MIVLSSPASAKEFSATDWKTVSAGGAHACATTNSGSLYCWGSDEFGQLGNSEALESKTTPVQIGGSGGWTVVSAGGSHTCGIRNGKLYCWGKDDRGQLGNGSASSSIRATPQQISGATDWQAVTAGGNHTCAIRAQLLACWGLDDLGQVGNGPSGSASVPAQVSRARWKSVSAGSNHTCGILTNNLLACWGDDSAGQVGNGSYGSPSVPAQTSNATWRSISAGGAHSCGVVSNGKLACWGSDTRGQIGNGGGTGTGPSVPAQVTTASDWISVSAGGEHTCGIRTNQLYCWGDNEFGQSDPASEDPLFTAPRIQADTWKAQEAGQRHTCAILSNGQMHCWGVPEPPPPDDCPTPPANVYAGDPWDELGYWKLTTPIDDSDSGSTADEVMQPALKTLTGQSYFDRLSDPTRIKFRADVDGATTSGSSFPRSELREMTQDGQYNRAAWSSNCGSHTMTINQVIVMKPTRPGDPLDPVVAGQIHDGGVDGGTGDVIMIRLEGTRLFVEGDNMDYGELDPSYQLGERFTVVITADETGIDVHYTPEVGSTVEINDIQPTVNNHLWYFKAGCYTQANETNGTGYGEVQIYNLDVTHSYP